MAAITLSDGRVMSYQLSGAEDGVPAIHLHGLTDSGQLRHYDDAFTASLGVRIIAPDMPGVGLSTPNPGRSLLGWVSDAVALADALHLDRFAVTAHSGGAAHALALAYMLPQRVTHLVLTSPVACFDEPDARRMIVSKELQTAVRFSRWHLFPLLRLVLIMLARQARTDLANYIEDTVINYPGDAEVFIESPKQNEIFKTSFRDGVAHRGEGMYEMVRTIFRPWGFRPEDVTQPAMIFYGDQDDIIAPAIPLRLAARMPNARAQLWPNGGHYEFVKRERWAEMMKAVVGK